MTNSEKTTPVTGETLRQAFRQTYLKICKEKNFDLFSTDTSEGCKNLLVATDVLANGVCGHFAPSQNADELCEARIRNMLFFVQEQYSGNRWLSIEAETGFAAGNYTLQDLAEVVHHLFIEELKLRQEFFTVQKKISERKAQMQ